MIIAKDDIKLLNFLNFLEFLKTLIMLNFLKNTLNFSKTAAEFFSLNFMNFIKFIKFKHEFYKIHTAFSSKDCDTAAVKRISVELFKAVSKLS